MDIREAYKILNATEHDSDKTIKLKFRQKMRQHHPDAIGADTPQQQQKAQKINEAYAILRNRKPKGKNRVFHGMDDFWTTDWQSEKEEQTQQEATGQDWASDFDERLFCERNIYVPYGMVMDFRTNFRTVTKGRYLWNPDLEEFSLLLISLNHATMALMEQIERRNEIYDNTEVGEQGFLYQKNIFNCLASQFIKPIRCLRKLEEPIQTDKEGRSIYLFHAFLGTRGSSKIFQAMAQLQKNDLLFPLSMEENRLTVSNEAGDSLGYLSLDDDQLYYVLIPILQNHMAQVKIQVEETFINKKVRPYQAKINVQLYLRLNPEAKDISGDTYNMKIASLLQEYEEYICEISK